VTNLASALVQLAAEKRRTGPICSVCRILEELPPEEAQALDAALGNGQISSKRISETLASSGLYASGRMIAYHRRSMCAAQR
jgi:hypothetical protein